MPHDNGFCPMCEWVMGWGWGTMLLVALFWIAVLGAVAWAIYRFARGRGDRGGSRGRATPEEALDRRYASGEIDRDEYLRTGEELTRDRHRDA